MFFVVLFMNKWKNDDDDDDDDDDDENSGIDKCVSIYCYARH